MTRNMKKGYKDTECAAETINLPLDIYFSNIGSGSNPLIPVMQNQAEDLKIENPADQKK